MLVCALASSTSAPALRTATAGNTINVPGDQPTLQAAVAAASSGDTILLAPGTYQGGVWIENKSLTIASRFATTGDASYIDQTIVSGNAANYCGGATGCRGDAVIEFGSSASGSSVVGLSVTSGPKGVRSQSIVDVASCHVTNTSDGVNYNSGSGGTISNSLFANNGDDGIDLNDDVETHIINNTIRDNRDDGIEFRVRSGSSPFTLDFTGNVITGNKEDGIQFIDSPDISPRTLRVERNVFSNNALAAVSVIAAGSTDTVEDLSGAPMAEHMYVVNNTFSAGNYGVVGGANAVVLNNVFSGNRGSAVRRVAGNSTTAYNDFWNNGVNYEDSNVDSAHTLLADPLLNADWTLGAGSPAIDAGTAFFQWQGETILNLPPTSYQGSAPDLGAFESGGGGPAPNTPPSVDAGPNQGITLPGTAALDGTVNDDGRPNPPGAVTTTWSVDSGPGTVTFANPNAVDTSASFSAAGTYVLRLTANDSALSASDTVQIVVQAAGTGSVDRRIATGNDDVEERATGSMYMNSSDIELVFDSDNQTDGLRFTNVLLPNHATVTGAYVQFEADETQSEATSLLVQGQAADNAATFTSTTRNVSGRPRTAASATWSPQAWTLVGEAGPKQRTPDLSAVVQEIVNRSGWVSGNALAIIISGTGHRTARAFEGKAAGAALLHVDYVSGSSDAAPSAKLTVTPASGTVPLGVSADASASTDTDATPIASYSFDFGDGSATVGPQAGATTTHTYTAAGTYTVTVTAKDTAGLSSTATARVTATDLPPNAKLSVNPASGNTPLGVTADASTSTDTDATPIATYSFDFGDGSATVGPQAGATATHTYTTAGTYTVTVTVKDTAGLSSTATAQVRVSTPGDAAPTAALNVNPASGSPPLGVTADASASTDTDATPIATYSFDFGDGSATVGPQAAATATHTYTTAGTYTVTVTVKDTAGLSSTATAQVSVGGNNLIANSGFETDLSGWNSGASTTPLTRVSGGRTGSWAAKLANTGTSATSCTLNDSPNWVKTTSAGTYTGTIWVRADAAGGVLKLRFREYSGSTLVATATSQFTLTTSWQQVTVTYRVPTAGTSLDFNAYISSAPPGTCFYADDASITLG